jgi:hypothetical protein
MVFKAIFNNISVIGISWQSVLLVEESRRPGETTDLSQVTDKFDHIMLYLIEIRTQIKLPYDHDHDGHLK